VKESSQVSIWSYDDTSRQPKLSLDEWNKSECPFCKERLPELHWRGGDGNIHQGMRSTRVGVCQICGWWRAEEYLISSGDRSGTQYRAHRAIVSSLKHLNLTDITTPVEDVRRYLAAKYEARFHVHPKLMEETVASVFRDHGYEAKVTGRSGDDGVDVILVKGRDQIGVQVKRYKNLIQVEQIRSLQGALVLNGLTKGIFVTTSGFQSGGKGTVRRLAERGYAIELFDAERFYGALSIAQRSMYGSRREFDQDHQLPSMLPIVFSEGTRERPF